MRINAFLLFLAAASIAGLFLLTTLSGDSEQMYQEIQDNLSQVLHEQKQDLDEFEHQLSVYSNPFFIPDASLFSKRVFINGTLVYWNDTDYLGEYHNLKEKDTLYLYDNGYGLKMVQRKEVVADHDLIEIFSFVSLYDNPQIRNKYLAEAPNPHIFEGYPVIIDGMGKVSMYHAGRALFSMTLIEESSLWNELVGLFLALVLFGSGLLLVLRIPRVKSFPPRIRILLLAVLLVVGRTALWYWTKDHLSHWSIFKPINFTAEPIFYSLGDTIINLIIALIWLVTVYRSFFLIPGMVHLPGSIFKKGLIASGVAVFILSLSLLSYGGVWMLLENSQIPLDIAKSINFDELRVYAFLCLLLVGLNVVLAFSMSIRVFNDLKLPAWFHYLVIVATFLLFSLVVGEYGWVVGGAFILAWLIIDFFGFSKRLRLFRYQTFVYLIILITSYTLVCAFAIYKHTEKDVRVAKEKFGNRLLIKNDILGELYLSEIIKEIENDRYVRTRLLSRLLSRQNIREKIRRQFLSSYFKKYDINVYLFDSNGESLQPETNPLPFQEWEKRFREDSLATDYEKIYFIQDLGENVRNKYICFLNIDAYGRNVGHIILDLTLKKYIPTSVFPELLLESRYFVSGANEFDYAVYKNGEILYKQGRFSFENKLSHEDIRKDQLYQRGVEREGVHYYGVKTQDGRAIIITSSTYENSAFIANFSFNFLLLFFAFGVALMGFQLVVDNSRFNLSTKIQLYLGLSFILPMLIVSVALLNTLNSSYREEIDRNFRKRSYNLAENLIDPTESFVENQINIDVYANEIAKAGALAQSDLNIYDIKGRLVTSSQPEIFRLGLLSNLIDPDAFREVRYKREQNLITERAIGTLDFKTSYTALRAYDDGRLLAILAMPYFDSKNHLKRQQVEVFSNLISIFTVIFLISIFVGNIIVGNLVQPLKKIGEKLRSTSLEEENQPIAYEAEDEIGSLIKEYNLMLLKLEESKEALAASQKESAWKEIARQVAHEIKNPLTPMRLKIQQMMKSFNTNEKNYKACLTLIDQVDTLSSIADSFSEFAKMPAPNYKPTDICRLLDSVAGLYQSESVAIRKRFEKECPNVYVDPKIFTGIFTNIILNAIQAAGDQPLEIVMRVKEVSSKILVSIQDNGKGIPEELKENIFTPYFSTKRRGSGIGLAVAKKGIENAGGNIWFESEEGKGTTFFISLPVVKV